MAAGDDGWIKAFSETDFTEDLKKIDVPTLILHDDVARTAPATASNFPPTGKAVEADQQKVQRSEDQGNRRLFHECSHFFILLRKLTPDIAS